MNQEKPLTRNIIAKSVIAYFKARHKNYLMSYRNRGIYIGGIVDGVRNGEHKKLSPYG